LGLGVLRTFSLSEARMAADSLAMSERSSAEVLHARIDLIISLWTRPYHPSQTQRSITSPYKNQKWGRFGAGKLLRRGRGVVHTRGGKAGAGTNLRRVAILAELGGSRRRAARGPRATLRAIRVVPQGPVESRSGGNRQISPFCGEPRANLMPSSLVKSFLDVGCTRLH
jgi:hypothetical protein